MVFYSSLEKLNMQYRVLKYDDTLPFLRSGIVKAQSVIVFLMPYSCGVSKGNMSYYAKGRDYHLRASDALKDLPELENARAFSDVSPYDERHLAAAAGLGVMGRNGLLINQTLGSFVFIGELVTDSLFDRYDTVGEEGSCIGCGKCVEACPSGGIDNKEMCVSHLTQKKGSLSDDECKFIRESGYIWGCDICQRVCPMNKLSDEPAFFLGLGDLEGLSGRQFREKYRDSAFTWRGVKPLLRNLEILSKKSRCEMP